MKTCTKYCLLFFFGVIFTSLCLIAFANAQNQSPNDKNETSENESENQDQLAELAKIIRDVTPKETKDAESTKSDGKRAETPKANTKSLTIEEEHLYYLELERNKIENEKKALNELKKEVESQLEKLETVRQNIDDFLTKQEQKSKAEEQKLVKMIESMPLEEAGKILGAMDEKMALSIMMKMKPKSLSKLLASMDPIRAARISKQLLDTDARQ